MRIAILHASAGHGHAKAGEAIREGFLACGVSEKDILLLDALDVTPSWFRKFYTSLYYYSVKHTPKLWGISYSMLDAGWFYYSIGKFLRRQLNQQIGKGLINRMIAEKPDAIIFTHFLAPEVLGHYKMMGSFSSLYVTVVTDFLPHIFWVNPETDYYWVMSEEGKRILERRGIPTERIVAGGIPISPQFKFQNRKKEIRKNLKLEENRFTILVTSGSFGLGPTSAVLDGLKEFAPRIQAIVVCGRNETQCQSLEKEGYPFPVRIFGFVSNMDELMEASDLLIAKPGGATTAESLAKGLPMVVLKPIPGQEAGNASLLRERNASFFLEKPSDIRVIIKGILDYPQVLEEKKKSIERLAKADAGAELAKFVLERIKK